MQPQNAEVLEKNWAVFISYSWDDEEHKAWVLAFANRLRGDGIDAILDQTHLQLGGRTPEFMERSVTESRCVLVICTEQYKGRFDGRIGGVGYEGHIITGEMVSKVGVNKFIPVLRNGDWGTAMPTALNGIHGVDLRDDSNEEYQKLVKHLHGVNEARPVGGPPVWLHSKPSELENDRAQRVAPVAEASSLPVADLPLISEKRGPNLAIWLRNETLDPIDRCGITLTNLQQYSINRRDFHRNPFAAIPLIRPHTVNAGDTTKEAATLAGLSDTKKRELSIAQRIPFRSAVTLMAELAVEGNGNTRNEVLFISWEPGEDPRLVEDPRSPVPEKPVPVVITPQEYVEQRKRLADSDLVNKIWRVPRWCIWSRPEEFKKARFRDLDHCRQFIALASVRSHARWSQYPWFSNTPEQDEEAVASGIEIEDQSIKHLERWVLFRSGQFVHNLALDEIPQLSGQTHVLEILDTTTAFFEFAGRMEDRKILSGRVAIAFEFHKVEGRQLTWPQDIFHASDLVGDSWCQYESFMIERFYSATDLVDRRRALALEVSLDIYSRFGWIDPPKEKLEELQQQRFGPAIHL